MSLATKCVDIDAMGGGSVVVHRFKDGVIQLHAIKDTDEDGPFDGQWQIVTLTDKEAETLIWGLNQALREIAALRVEGK